MPSLFFCSSLSPRFLVSFSSWLCDLSALHTPFFPVLPPAPPFPVQGKASSLVSALFSFFSALPPILPAHGGYRLPCLPVFSILLFRFPEGVLPHSSHLTLLALLPLRICFALRLRISLLFVSFGANAGKRARATASSGRSAAILPPYTAIGASTVGACVPGIHLPFSHAGVRCPFFL